jgi:hypothetical protein
VTVAFTNLTFNGNFSFGKIRSRRESNLAVGVLTDLGEGMFCPKKKKSLQESCRMGWRIDADSLIC